MKVIGNQKCNTIIQQLDVGCVFGIKGGSDFTVYMRLFDGYLEMDIPGRSFTHIPEGDADFRMLYPRITYPKAVLDLTGGEHGDD